jgi:hypothetical protein
MASSLNKKNSIGFDQMYLHSLASTGESQMLRVT